MSWLERQSCRTLVNGATLREREAARELVAAGYQRTGSKTDGPVTAVTYCRPFLDPPAWGPRETTWGALVVVGVCVVACALSLRLRTRLGELAPWSGSRRAAVTIVAIAASALCIWLARRELHLVELSLTSPWPILALGAAVASIVAGASTALVPGHAVTARLLVLALVPVALTSAAAGLELQRGLDELMVDPAGSEVGWRHLVVGETLLRGFRTLALGAIAACAVLVIALIAPIRRARAARVVTLCFAAGLGLLLASRIVTLGLATSQSGGAKQTELLTRAASQERTVALALAAATALAVLVAFARGTTRRALLANSGYVATVSFVCLGLLSAGIISELGARRLLGWLARSERALTLVPSVKIREVKAQLAGNIGPALFVPDEGAPLFIDPDGDERSPSPARAPLTSTRPAFVPDLLVDHRAYMAKLERTLLPLLPADGRGALVVRRPSAASGAGLRALSAPRLASIPVRFVNQRDQLRAYWDSAVGGAEGAPVLVDISPSRFLTSAADFVVGTELGKPKPELTQRLKEFARRGDKSIVMITRRDTTIDEIVSVLETLLPDLPFGCPIPGCFAEVVLSSDGRPLNAELGRALEIEFRAVIAELSKHAGQLR